MFSRIKRFLRRFPSGNGGTELFEPSGSKKPSFPSLLLSAQRMASLRDTDELLGYLLGEIQKNLGLDAGVLVAENENAFRIRSHRGFSAALVGGLSVPLGEGAVGGCFSTRERKVLAAPELPSLGRAASLLAEEGWRSAALLPLVCESHTLGVFLALSKEGGTFTPAFLDEIQSYVEILSLGMRNAQLAERMEKFHRRLEAEVSSTTRELTLTNQRLIRRVRELKALYEITLTAGTRPSLEEIFTAVTSRVQELLNVDCVGYFINASPREGGMELLSQHPSFGLPRELCGLVKIDSNSDPRLGPAFRKVVEAFRTGSLQVSPGAPSSLFRELPEPVRFSLAQGGAEDASFRSLVAIPLNTAQKTLGVMVLLHSLRERFSLTPAIARGSEGFSEEEIRTLTLVAVRVATAIENAQLDSEIQRRLADLSTLQEISDAFYATPVLEFVLGKIVKIAEKSLPCDLCTFLFFDPAAAALVSPPAGAAPDAGFSAEQIPVQDQSRVSAQVFSEGRARIVDDVREEPAARARFDSEKGMRSMMFVPLKVERQVIGIMRLGSKIPSYFNPHHLRLAELIADRAGVIVENARLYEKILQANRELERLNHVKTEFVSMVSHELRTPVTAIKGFVDLILHEEAGPVNDQQKRFLTIAHNSIDRLTLLIGDLLDISRIESGQLKLEFAPVSIARVLQESADTYRGTIAGKKIHFAVECDKKLPVVFGDESRIKQVVDNLLSNAMKFTPAGGSIRVSADDLGDFVLVSASDNGVGVKKEDQERIFEKFYQVDSSLTRQVGGTGLGLAISKSIVELHGGRIWVESEPGKGSTFRFLLPRHREKEPEEEAASDARTDGTSQGGKAHGA